MRSVGTDRVQKGQICSWTLDTPVVNTTKQGLFFGNPLQYK